MKLDQYLQENTVTGFEVIPNQIALSVITDSTRQALAVDTSNIPSGTQLTVAEDFEVDGDTVRVAGITLDASEVEILETEDRP